MWVCSYFVGFFIAKKKLNDLFVSMGIQLYLFPPERERIISECISKFNLPSYARNKIIYILDNSSLENSLICCHANCLVCDDVIKKCVDAIKGELEKYGYSKSI